MSDVDAYGERTALGLTRPYSPDFPLRSPYQNQPSEKRRADDGLPVRGNPETVNPAGSDSWMARGPRSPLFVDNESDSNFPEASSALIETTLTTQSPSRTPSDYQALVPEAQGNESMYRKPKEQRGILKPRIVSNFSTDGGPVSLPHTNQRSKSPRVIVPQGDAVAMDRRHVSRSGSESGYASSSPKSVHLLPALQYHHQRRSRDDNDHHVVDRRSSQEAARSAQNLSRNSNALLSPASPRPHSSNSTPLERGYGGSPGRSAKRLTGTPLSHDRYSPNTRPLSYVDLLTLPYAQQAPPTMKFNHSHLQGAVGTNASLLSTRQTLEMYRANVKKTNDQIVQYSFAVFMVETANEMRHGVESEAAALEAGMNPAEMITEARHILQRLSDKSYPFAQYYLADGYATGLFSKGKPDDDKAFPLFVAASKHGHAESGYRAALCYEYGWGVRKDPLKAVQFYRQSASKNHPGAMMRLARACLSGDLGLGPKYREGIKWLKRAAESADAQWNSAPYELGLLHESGYGDDIFPDEAYAAQLFTQSADLGHAEANFKLGDAYEHGKLTCPRDAALSVHFYNGGASRGHAGAMMALCAWYMVGAPPILDKDENEAYEWATRAAALGLPKAEYAVGYFTEMGIGCRRDPLEANVWYVRAADQGEERAKRRIAAIQTAASGGPPVTSTTPSSKATKDAKRGKSSPTTGERSSEGQDKQKRWGIF